MSGHPTRPQIQSALRKVILSELERLDLPHGGEDGGRALHRVARALVYINVELLMSSLPATLAFAVVVGAAKKAIARHPTMPTVFSNVPPAKA